jgi:hypothetical protein
MLSTAPGIPVHPESEKFDGTGWTAFKTKILAHLKGHGLSGYIDGTILNPSPPTAASTAGDAPATPLDPLATALPAEPTTVYSQHLSINEWMYRDGIALSILILNTKDPVGVGLRTDGSAYNAWKSLEDIYARQTDMALSRAQRELNSTYLAPGASVIDHAATMRKLRQAANDVGTAITDSVFRSTFITSLSEEWRHITPVLRTFTSSAEVINFLIEEDQLRNRVTIPTTALATTNANHQQANAAARRAARQALVCTNPTCMTVGRKGHTIEECFHPGRGKASQYLSWWQGKKHGTPAANSANTTPAYMFAARTVPAADVSVYDVSGVQDVRFQGEHILVSPAALMDWSDVSDAVTELEIDTYLDPLDGVSSLGGSASASSFEVVSSPTSDVSSFVLVGTEDTDDVAYTVATIPVSVFQSQTAGRTIAILDSGCTDHCFRNRTAFEGYQPFDNREGTGVEGSKFRISGTGVVQKSTILGGVKHVELSGIRLYLNTAHFARFRNSRITV